MKLPDLVGMACHIGAFQALEFREFAESIGELTAQQRKMLLRAWLALESMPKDADLERRDLLNVITGLRQAWMREKK